MKTKFFYQLVIFELITFIGAGCENKAISNEEPQVEYPSEAEPMVDYELAIIEMTPEMQENIFVMPIVDSLHWNYNIASTTLYYGDGLALCSPSYTDTILSDFAQNELGLLGTSPYIMLEEGYVIIDWKWAHFHPLSGELRGVRYPSKYSSMNVFSTSCNYLNSLNVNEEYYELPLKWTDLKSLAQIWKMGEGQRITKPIVHHIIAKDIEKYGNLETTFLDIQSEYHGYRILDLYHTYLNIYKNDEYVFHSYVTKIDRLQEAYVETLNQMIRTKNFELWH